MHFPETGGDGGIDSKHFVKLKNDKDSIVGIFRGEPHLFRQHWINKRSFLCSENSECEHCKSKNKSTFRFRINFITKENNVYVAKVFEQGFTVYGLLKSLHETDYPLEKTVLRITRSGTGQDTTYTILPIPKGEVTPELEKMLASVQLHDLGNLEKTNGSEGPQGDTPPPFSEDDIPF